MLFKFNGQLTDFEAYSVQYANDMLNGIFLDSDSSYSFLSDHIEAHREIMESFDDEIDHFDMSQQDIDFSQPPHSWVINCLERFIVSEAEALLDDST